MSETTLPLLRLATIALIASFSNIAVYGTLSAAPPESVETSPLPPWSGEIAAAPDRRETTFERALLWIPNRIVDLLDLFRIDLGIGPAGGAVLRITRLGQIGSRNFWPGSLRVGLFGRKAPLLLESTNEFGIGPTFHTSPERSICPGIIAVGADLAASAHIGICLDEVADFLAGIFLFDLLEDDLF